MKWISIYGELFFIHLYAFIHSSTFDWFVVLICHIFAIGLAIVLKIFMASEKRRKEKMESIRLLFLENERNRIGRDLHDTLGHVFAMLSVKSELSLVLLSQKDDVKLKKELEDIMYISRSSMKNVRDIIQQSYQSNLYDELSILKNILEDSSIGVVIEGEHVIERIPKDYRDMLSMVLRELGTNVLKHAQATKCSIRFLIDQQDMIIEMEDNGIGFSSLTGEELHTVKDRMVILKGSATIISLKNPTLVQLRFLMEEDKE
ncbi:MULTISPECIES: sensor histidine kinase [unclassified Granulicatella]|uniref:sensor histidine kinase n=1 Tax=unclassified Granulicatella TaxID=2630493 RepID=UPI00143225EF|nr:MULTISPECIES: histidine kinase [unclassified Granulicatella]MBF0779806.1 hypothetical protein [Granulicatella sp. 19428wC4_WM01]